MPPADAQISVALWPVIRPIVYCLLKAGNGMKAAVDSPRSGETPNVEEEQDKERREAVLAELKAILDSSVFRSASRCRQFLQYIVQHQLDGHPEQLKERTIGTEVFQRPAHYSTGDDPVVRVQAGEVRRRLETYYQTTPADSPLWIELPRGSYVPTFHWRSLATATGPETAPPTPAPHPDTEASHSATFPPDPPAVAPARPFRFGRRLSAGIALLLLITAAIFAFRSDRNKQQKSAMDQFWAPIFNTRQPILICLAKPVVYRPTQDLYHRYQISHPGTFATEADRTNQPLPLNSSDKISWDDLYQASDYGVALGDAYAAINLSMLLGQMGKPSQVRIGNSYISYEDLRSSPSVVVGAFDNKWTLQLTSNLHFSFVEDGDDFSIRELTAGHRIWRTQYNAQGQPTEDFALIARLLDSRTGQFTVAVAGVSGAGTEAAGEFLSNSHLMGEALRAAPPGWQQKNLELVLETPVTDSVPGPAHVVASYFW
jgi:YD repeat-containing protein